MMTVRLTWPPQEGFILSAKKRFNRIYQKDWFNSELAEAMVKDVDNTEHIHDATFESPVLGTIPAQMLSGGVKGLLMILNQDKIHTYSSVIFGDNCIPWLCKLSYTRDFTLFLEHSMAFSWDPNAKVNAQTLEGKPLATEREIQRYFRDNYDIVQQQFDPRYDTGPYDKNKDPEYLETMASKKRVELMLFGPSDDASCETK